MLEIDNKKKKIIIISFLLLLFLVIIWFLFFLNTSKRDNIIQTTKNLFPFGKIETGKSNFDNTQQIIEEKEEKIIEEKEEKKKEEPRLRRVSDFPTGGFIPLLREEEKEIKDIVIDENGVKTEKINIIKVKNNFVRYSAIDDSTFYEAKLTPYNISRELLVENFVPNTEYAFFSRDGNNIILQYWDNVDRSISTYLAKIKKRELDIKKCPYDFSKKINIDDNSKNVLDLHIFLNKNPRTKITEGGLNSPGNESPIATKDTITAIKNFQSLYSLDIDGKLGPATRKKMYEVCDEYELKEAKERFNKLDKKYETTGFFLPQNIVAIDISPDGKKYFYLKKDKLGVVGVIRKFNDNSKKIIFESPYYGWIVQWNNKDNIELTTKASYKSKGFTYYLNPNTGEYHKSFKEKDGLTTLTSPDNSKIFLQENSGTSIKNSIFDRKKTSFSDIFIQTFPEKCVWAKKTPKLYCAVPESLSNGEKYPDTWYQGLELFTDSLWLINTDTNEITLLSNLNEDYKEKIDVSKIGIDEDEDYLYFIDKNTEFLWSYRLMDI